MTAPARDGFGATKQEQYERDLVDRYGSAVEPQIQESKRRMALWSADEKAEISARFADLEQRLAARMDAGVEPDDPSVQHIIAEQYEFICRFWTPNAESYAGLGDLYAEHPDFRARKQAVHPGLAEFERDAMTHYAVTRLT